MDINSLLSPSDTPGRESSGNASATASPTSGGRRKAPTSAAGNAIFSTTPTPTASSQQQQHHHHHQQQQQLQSQQQAHTHQQPLHQYPQSSTPTTPAIVTHPQTHPAHRQLPAHLHIPPMSPSRHAALQQGQQWTSMPSPAGSNYSPGQYSPRSVTHPQNVVSTPPPMERQSSQSQSQSQHPQQRPPLHRAPTSGMDTLADLASMQQHQQATPRSHQLQRQISNGPGANASARPSLENFRRQHSGSRGSIDMTMLDTAPKPKGPVARSLTSASLGGEDLRLISQLFDYLHDNPHSYQSHAQLVRLLRKGFRAHTIDEATGDLRRNPRTYELTKELQEANDSMSRLFAVGEEMWLERLQDQQLLAFTVEECMGVVETCQQALVEEPSSTALWELFGKWRSLLYEVSNSVDGEIPAVFRGRFAAWSVEDKTVAREFFQRSHVIDTWRRGSQETMYDISNSHLVWDRYMGMLLEDLEKQPSEASINATRDLFERRLQTPHGKWDQTFQQFSQFVSRHFQSSYEQAMVRITQMSQSAKSQYEARGQYEAQWRQVQQTGNQEQESIVAAEYLEWELGRSKKKKSQYNPELSRALYLRVLLRFPLYTDLWEDFILFLADELQTEQFAKAGLPVLDRATAHCPWSGKLWGHYIRAGELANLSFEEMSLIKHRATSKGLLDASPLEEHVVINTSWCSYLRRRALSKPSYDEDELDVTEVGIRSAIEEMEVLGRQRHGKDYQGDPNYRLERIYIRFCTTIGDGIHIQTARDMWKKLVARRSQSSEFWLWYFLWERIEWVKNPGSSPSPRLATNVLIQGIGVSQLDWPEKLIEYLIKHVEDYEDPEGQLAATVAVRKARKEIEKRRAEERAEAEQLTAQQQQYQQQQYQQREDDAHHRQTGSVMSGDEALVNGKRKRDIGEDAAGDASHKKARSADPQELQEVAPTDTNGSEQPPQLKRDREHATVTVKNLPANVKEGQVRQFFRDCGDINSIKLVTGSVDDDAEPSMTAHIEFDGSDDALAARTRDMKSFGGRVISVQVESGSTIYCANYPAAADDTYIRDLFSPYGKILDIRFPSLKHNTHRRFCYVQFATSDQAKAAETALDGRTMVVGEGQGSLQLIAKVSDPSHKQNRSGALEEGREVHVGNLDWNATEDEMKSIFEKHGVVERVRIPQNMNGKSKGMAFVVFQTANEAREALILDGTKIRSRSIAVSLATKNHAKRTATALIGRARSTTSPSPSVAQSTGDADDGGVITTREEIASRTISLLDVPDTVNDARIRSICEKYGDLAKIVLRPDRGGAMVEFANAAGAGKASMALEGYEISPGRSIRVGTIQDLLTGKGEQKQQRGVMETSTKPPAASGTLGSGVIRRPGQGTGKRGGLGLRRVGGAPHAPRARTGRENDMITRSGSESERADNEDKTGKSNSEFRAMVSRT